MKRFPQSITYWHTSPDGYGGFTFGAPTAIEGRWEDKNQLFLNLKGEEEVSSSIIYTDQQLTIGDYVYEGTSVAANPAALDGAKRIRQLNKTPSLNGSRALYKAYL